MPDVTKMCINVTTSPWSRVRHWSAPERLQWTELEPQLSNSSQGSKSLANQLTERDLLPMSTLATAATTLSKSQTDFHKPDVQFFTDISPCDNLFGDDPFNDDPDPVEEDDPIACHDFELTSEEMEQRWLQLWSPKKSNMDSDGTSNIDDCQSRLNEDCVVETSDAVTTNNNTLSLQCEVKQYPQSRSRRCSVSNTVKVPKVSNRVSQTDPGAGPTPSPISSWLSFSLDRRLLVSSTKSTSASSALSTYFQIGQTKRSCLTTNPFLWLLISSVLLIVTPASAKICSTRHIYHLSQMESKLRNCTVIEGSLTLSHAIDVGNNKSSIPVSPEQLRFPELREITDFLLLWQIDFDIKSLAPMFPNLSVIRGNRLIKDFALLIREMKGMEEIGLHSLTHILRGGVHIEKNNDLCYVDTINWKAIVTKKYHGLINIDSNSFMNKNCMNKCPAACRDTNASFCWNEYFCQTLSVPCPHGSPGSICYRNGTSENGQLFQCDKECLGGCSGQTQDTCFACAHARVTGKDGGCRRECPEPSLLFDRWRCITEKECSNMTFTYNAETINQQKPFKAYNGECLENCPEETKEKKIKEDSWICEKCDNCPLECQGAVISSLEDMYRFKGCTTIKGDLSIQVRGENVVEELTRHMSRVKTITGSLKIARSFPIVSLDFFQSLEEIQGIHPADSKENKKHYSITIMENENLQKLFSERPHGRNVQIRTRNGPDGVSHPGKAFIHYNPKLCSHEIKKLLNDSGLEDPGVNSAEISYATNGDKAVCSESKLDLDISFGASNELGRSEKLQKTMMTVQFTNYQSVIEDQNPTGSHRALLGYEIHYREIDEATYVARNLSKYGGRDACGGDEWEIIDHPPTDQDWDQKNAKPIWPSEVTFIMVQPYTYYALFVTTLIVKEVSGSAGIDGAQSDIKYILTPEDYPTPPDEVSVTRLNYSTVNITWAPPISPNGIIDHYDLLVTFVEYNLTKLYDIKYCDESYKKRQVIVPQPEKPPVSIVSNITNGECSCDCRTCGKQSKKGGVNSKEKKFMEESLVDQLVDTLLSGWSFPAAEESRSKRSIPQQIGDNKGNQIISDEKEPEVSTTPGPYSVHEIRDDQVRHNVTAPKITDPRPYSKMRKKNEYADNVFVLYSVEIPGNVNFAIINDLQHDSPYEISIRACQRPTGNAPKRCSNYEKKEFRTLYRPHADDIPGEVEVINEKSSSGSKENETSSFAWLTWEPPKNPNTFIISYNIRSIKDDDKYKIEDCKTAKEFEEAGNRHKFTYPGTYRVVIQAVPLYAEPGQWTTEVKVSVAGGDQTQFVLSITLPIIIVVLLIIASLVVYIKKKEEPASLISNDIYHLVENIFSRDEYWIDREKVEVGELIGSGAFGEVHEGIYKHPSQGNIKVAIKMLRENASLIDRRLFLEEATIMKNLRSAHIVELIGAVPNGFPSYILLEMMPNGDLKKFLRDSRPISLNRQAVRPPPTENELLQMALEIADGMAYLSSRPRSIVHRDLAARNCLMTADNIVKVGDFGRARDVYESEYYRQTFRGMVPVRWMPPESLRDGEYVTKSDVWSYGVVLWEMATLAEEPYQGMPHDEVVRYIIDDGGKPAIRSTFPESLTKVMEQCWRRYPDDRPSFIDICQMLDCHANERFRNTAFVNSPEGQEFISNSGEDAGELSERAPLRGRSSSGCGNGNTGNSNGDARSASTTDNGHAVMAAAAASELGSVPSHTGEVRPLGTSTGVAFRNPSGTSSASSLSNIRNLWNRFKNGGRVIRGPQDTAADA